MLLDIAVSISRFTKSMMSIYDEYQIVINEAQRRVICVRLRMRWPTTVLVFR